MESTLDLEINEMLKPLNGQLRSALHSVEYQINAFQETHGFSTLSEKQKSKANDIITLASDADFNPTGAFNWYEEFRLSLGVENSLRPLRELVAELLGQNHQKPYGGTR